MPWKLTNPLRFSETLQKELLIIENSSTHKSKGLYNEFPGFLTQLQHLAALISLLILVMSETHKNCLPEGTATRLPPAPAPHPPNCGSCCPGMWPPSLRLFRSFLRVAVLAVERFEAGAAGWVGGREAVLAPVTDRSSRYGRNVSSLLSGASLSPNPGTDPRRGTK